MSKLLFDLQELTRAKYQNGLFDHFNWFISPHMWTSTLTDSGSAAVGDAKGGILTLTPSDGSVVDNDEAYVSSTNELFIFATGQSIVVEGSIKYTEAATNAANVAVGMQNAVGANSIIDDGGGLKVSGSTIGIYKIDGELVWRCVCSINGVSQVGTSTTSSVSTSYQILRVEVRAITSTSAEVHYFVNGLPLLDSNNRAIFHFIDPSATPTEMNVFAGVKNGSANQQTLLVDYLGGYQGAL